jgi:hypothetical protein
MNLLQIVTYEGDWDEQRDRPLVVPTATTFCPARCGWPGGSLIAAIGLVVLTWVAAGSTHARDDEPLVGKSAVHGRVVDDAAKPIAGARVRLYRRDGRWERRHAIVEEVTAGPDGAFSMKSALVPNSRARSRGLPPYVLLADAPGKAVGWKTVPAQATTFVANIILTAPVPRGITVIDADGRPVPRAMVEAYTLGDPSSTSPLFRELLEVLRVDDGPLTAITDAAGHATIGQLPGTGASFVATKPGFAEGYAFREQDTIRVTPSAALSGTLSGPDGKPLVGVKIVLFAAFMWDFENAVTDANGRYQFTDLKARGWDMSAWGRQSKPGSGTYKIWIESDSFAVPTKTVTLEPKTRETLDLQAEKAGVIRVTVTEEGTDKPVSDVRIWGFDKTTGSSGRFNAYTDSQGRASFHSTPEEISLSIVGPPDGYYIKGNLRQSPDASKQIKFSGGEVEVNLVMPPIAGPLIAVSGICTRPDGSPVAGAKVSLLAGDFVTSGSTNFLRVSPADDRGQFTLADVPAGLPLLLYAETADRRLAGTATVRLPEKVDSKFRLHVPVAATFAVEIECQDKLGQPLPSRMFHISPKMGEQEFASLRRTAESNEDGMLKLDGIIPGLSYRVQEDVPPREGPVGFVGGKPPWYDEVLVLVPMNHK